MRMRVQFSLRTLLAVIVVAAIATLIWERTLRRERALRAIQSLGGVLTYGQMFPIDPLDEEAHAEVVTIDFVRPVHESDLREILRFVARLGPVDLIFVDARFGTAGLRQLSALDNLEGLLLVEVEIDVRGGEMIGQMQSLRCLGFGKCTISPGALEPLVNLPGLESLHIGECQFSKPDALALAKRLPNIRVVYIDGANVFHEDDRAALMP